MNIHKLTRTEQLFIKKTNSQPWPRSQGRMMKPQRVQSKSPSKPEVPPNEAERMQALEDFKLLDTDEETELNDIVHLA